MPIKPAKLGGAGIDKSKKEKIAPTINPDNKA